VRRVGGLPYAALRGRRPLPHLKESTEMIKVQPDGSARGHHAVSRNPGAVAVRRRRQFP
jgi:hypothetical protein